MDSKIIDGKHISNVVKDELVSQVEDLKEKGIHPGLAVVLVGDNPASKIYVGSKKKSCEQIGIKSFSYEMPDQVSEKEVLDLILTLNKDEAVHGILVQLPLPQHIDEQKVLLAIDPKKDVDGFHPMSVGALVVGAEGFVSCTPAGIIELLKRYQVEIEGKHCVVVGRSNIVGKPISMLLLKEHGTVSICHSRTKDLGQIVKQADIIVAAVGVPQLITQDMIKKGAVIIDVGMNRLDNGKLCGDVDFEGCIEKASLITPVPGGVGPMTIAMLMKNCVISASKLLEENIIGN